MGEVPLQSNGGWGGGSPFAGHDNILAGAFKFQVLGFSLIADSGFKFQVKSDRGEVGAPFAGLDNLLVGAPVDADRVRDRTP